MRQQRSCYRRFLLSVALLLMTSLSNTVFADIFSLVEPSDDNGWESIIGQQGGPSKNNAVPGVEYDCSTINQDGIWQCRSRALVLALVVGNFRNHQLINYAIKSADLV